MTEAALYSVPLSHVETLRKKGGAGELLHKLRSNIEKPITAVLTLNTVANTAGATIVGAAGAQEFGEGSLGLFAAVFTIVILIFSEILPKTIGVAYARSLAPLLAYPLYVFVVLLTPFMWVTSALSRLVAPKDKEHKTDENDITAVAGLSLKSGKIQPFEEEAIRHILALDTKTVADVMTPRTVVFSLKSSMTVRESRKVKDIWHYSRIPVHEADDTEDVIGVVYRRHVLHALAEDQDDKTMADLMRPVHFVQESLPLDRLLHRFLESRLHLFVVLDEYGGLAGVVSLEDVLEEMLGKEIMDETDEFEDMRALAKRRREMLVRNK